MKNKDFNKLKRTRREHLANLRLQKQWNQILADEGLSVNEGRSNKVIYAGDLNDLGIIEKYRKGDRD